MDEVGPELGLQRGGDDDLVEETGFVFTLRVLYLSRLITDFEVHAKSGYSQVIFLIGVVLGSIVELIFVRIDARLTEAGQP